MAFGAQSQLVIFDIHSRLIRPLRSGAMPRFMRDHRLLFFWQTQGSTEDLYKLSIGQSDNAMKIANGPSTNSFKDWITDTRRGPVAAMSNDDVLFLGNDLYVWRYNLTKSALTRTDVRNCGPKGWRIATQELICGRGSNEYFTIRLDGRNSRYLKTLSGARGLFYVPELDSAFYAKEWGSVLRLTASATSIRAYDFKTEKEDWLSERGPFYNDGTWCPR